MFETRAIGSLKWKTFHRLSVKTKSADVKAGQASDQHVANLGKLVDADVVKTVQEACDLRAKFIDSTEKIARVVLLHLAPLAHLGLTPLKGIEDDINSYCSTFVAHFGNLQSDTVPKLYKCTFGKHEDSFRLLAKRFLDNLNLDMDSYAREFKNLQNLTNSIVQVVEHSDWQKAVRPSSDKVICELFHRTGPSPAFTLPYLRIAPARPQIVIKYMSIGVRNLLITFSNKVVHQDPRGAIWHAYPITLLDSGLGHRTGLK